MSRAEATLSAPTIVTVDGCRIRLTNLDKILYPETGTTKDDVLDYYARIADVLITHVANRPVTCTRWVPGVGTREQLEPSFFRPASTVFVDGRLEGGISSRPFPGTASMLVRATRAMHTWPCTRFESNPFTAGAADS